MQSSLWLHCVGVCVCAPTGVQTLKKCSLNTLFMPGTVQHPKDTTVGKDCIVVCPCSPVILGFSFPRGNTVTAFPNCHPLWSFTSPWGTFFPWVKWHSTIQKEKGDLWRRRESRGGRGRRKGEREGKTEGGRVGGRWSDCLPGSHHDLQVEHGSLADIVILRVLKARPLK